MTGYTRPEQGKNENNRYTTMEEWDTHDPNCKRNYRHLKNAASGSRPQGKKLMVTQVYALLFEGFQICI